LPTKRLSFLPALLPALLSVLQVSGNGGWVVVSRDRLVERDVPRGAMVPEGGREGGKEGGREGRAFGTNN
jgi:hypothetical protein